MDAEEILYIHYRVVKDYGGLQGMGSEPRFVSAVNKLNNNSGSLIVSLAYFVRDIIQDHPFLDGNKRTAVTVVAIVLNRNNYLLTCTPKELEEFAIAVATNNPTPTEIKNWLLKNTAKPNLA